ncbi:acetyl-CoA carboxylase biotin carboxylase subunit [Sulfitobacter sp. M22]|uniref:acetyl-CoA carboxylase biotin carboxylase subunit n=1 Tax=Sulfitobacter sp. M22 TaxID=2675332 RepID=UPI001F4799CA|nr:acetyl-CoA carboxylase biotin carboxylase subunit [Sulfitobacter sp. M22]MCF7728138.1 acetyl-CoA carboxylase biotin carboxylase subunit [Sulfitobacter sp. M22]
MSLKKVFVANRGEIALRIIRACEAEGIETVLGASEADRHSLPARQATQTVCIGPSQSSASYLDVDAVVTAAKGMGCDALHPGYGFLAENAGLSDKCAEHGIIFIGPDGATISKLGDKISARRIADAAGVPVVPGRDQVESFEDAQAAAKEIGFPVLLKAASGGGGRGMQVVHAMDHLRTAYDTARAEARNAFGDDTLYMERFIEKARHVEVQIFGDSKGNIVHLGERDCTLQRRHQKVVEEGPATAVAPQTIAKMHTAAVRLAQSVGYQGAGTVEFIYDQTLEDFFFLEVNTRIQVEHPVTELLTGVDLVREQLRVAAGDPLSVTQDDITLTGHVIECRINAEDARSGFLPSPGTLVNWQAPTGEGIRLDSHCHQGYEIPPFYDSMLAKLIVKADSRDAALTRMAEALAVFQIEGVTTTLPFLKTLIAHDEFRRDDVSTKWVEAVMDTPEFNTQLEAGS